MAKIFMIGAIDPQDATYTDHPNENDHQPGDIIIPVSENSYSMRLDGDLKGSYSGSFWTPTQAVRNPENPRFTERAMVFYAVYLVEGKVPY